MKYLCSFIILTTLLFHLSSCHEECEDVSYPEMTQVIQEAYNNPESFDMYVAQNHDTFDGKFQDCMNERISKLRQSADDEYNQCDDTFVQGSDFWNQCYNEVEVSMENGIIILESILAVTNGGSSFIDTSGGEYLISFKTYFPQDYNEVVLIVNELFADLPSTCEECEDKFLFF